ncbi:MAG: BatD family protein [Bacteroidales bacterium]|nr:BatD family protein [Bacteroidales bacterium]
MRKKLVLVFIGMFICVSSHVFADEVAFTAEAPRTVVMGQNFNIVYTSNAEAKDLRIAEFNHFEILAGPSTSVMSSSSNVNGQYSSSTTYRFTYVLTPEKTGTFTIPAATASINNRRYSSRSLTITVLPSDQQSGNGSSPASHGSSRSSTSTSSSNNLSSDIFIRAVPSRTRVREQESLTITYKIYTRVDISGFENPKFPEFTGFMAQEVEVSNNQQWDLENYNGSNYRTAILKKTVLFPQKSGTLNIKNGSFDVIVRVKNTNTRARSIFDDFFETYSEVKKTLSSNSLNIQVDPLPSGKPSDFCGVTGNLKMSSSITSTKVKANDAVTIKLNISGSGNLKMIPTPEFAFPADFEAYDPKVDNMFKTTASGVSGTKTIEYLVIPRYAGTFEIPAITLSYFDLASGSYKTLRSDSYQLEVSKGEGGGQTVSGNFTDQEQVRMLGSDIRYIKTNIKLHQKTNLIFGKTWFWLCFLLPLLFFALLLIINRKQVKANADVARVRNRKASKVAVKRLKQAGVYLKEGKKESFYDEVLKALWGYTSDKLNIPLSLLTKETIASQLADYRVEEDIRKEYMDILMTCEFARYAPGEDSHAMDALYEKTMNVMNKMENTIKK